MDEKEKKEIVDRVLSSGHSPLEITEKKWKQLKSLRRAAVQMLQNRKDALKIFKANEITVANVERMLKLLNTTDDDVLTITDQTMRNNGGLLEAFLLTFRKDDVKNEDLQEELCRAKKELARCRQEIDLLHRRDAEFVDALEEAERLRIRNTKLEKDQLDMQKKMSQMEAEARANNAKSHKAKIVELKINKGDA